jgi:prepilin-type N-terminal cleavage/methylation domain-containing protein
VRWAFFPETGRAIFGPRAFSLIELLVALAILAIVGALVIPKFLNLKDNAADRIAQAQIATINSVYKQWVALGGERNGSTSFETIYFLSKLPASPTAVRDCDIGACTDTLGNWGSTTVMLSGIPVLKVPDSYPTNDLPSKCFFSRGGGLAKLKIDRYLWRINVNDARPDPFYLTIKLSNLDENANPSEVTHYE